jgi:imidazolonepropionase-like amidohydrolase
VLSNATRANSAAELVAVIRQQLKKGADFIKVCETGPDSAVDGKLATNYQYTEAELAAAVAETARVGRRVAVRATGEPGTLWAARAGVVTIDHALQLSEETMRIIHEKQIFAVPTFAIYEYFAQHPETPEEGERERALNQVHAAEFRKQLAAGVPIAMGSDVGPFPHGTQALEFAWLVKYGMTELGAIQAGTLNGANVLGSPPLSAGVRATCPKAALKRGMACGAAGRIGGDIDG